MLINLRSLQIQCLISLEDNHFAMITLGFKALILFVKNLIQPQID